MPGRKAMLYSFRHSTLFVVLTVGLGLLSDLFLYALVVPILPSLLSSRAGLSPAAIQRATSLMLTSYALSAVLFSAPAGWMADRLFRRRSRAFLAGLVALAAGTAMLVAGRSVAVLVCARILQGASTAVVWTVGLALLQDAVGIQRMGATVGAIFGVIGGAQLAAPVLGGWLFETAGIGAVAGVALGMVVLDLIMRLAVIEGAERPETDDEDAEAPAAEQERRQQQPASGQASPDESQPLLHQRPAAQPASYLVPSPLPSYAKSFPILLLLRDPRLISAQLLTLTQSTQLSALDATVPTEAQSLLGYTSGPTGLLFLPLVLPFVLLNVLFGRLVDRVGPKAPALGGLAGQVPILLAMRLPALLLDKGADRAASTAVWATLLALMGAATAALGSGGIVAAGKVAEGYFKQNADVFGQGKALPFAQLFAVNSMVASSGLALGPVVAGLLREAIGYGNMNAVLAGLSAASALACYVYLDGWPQFGGGYDGHGWQEEEASGE